MNTTWFEKGVEKGIEKGRREALRKLLDKRFGPLTLSVQEKLEHLSTARLETILDMVFDVSSLKDLGLE